MKGPFPIALERSNLPHMDNFGAGALSNRGQYSAVLLAMDSFSCFCKFIPITLQNIMTETDFKIKIAEYGGVHGKK